MAIDNKDGKVGGPVNRKKERTFMFKVDGTQVRKLLVEEDPAFNASMERVLGNPAKLRALISRFHVTHICNEISDFDFERFIESLRGATKFVVAGVEMYLAQTNNFRVLVYTKPPATFCEIPDLISVTWNRAVDLEDENRKQLHITVVSSDELKVVFSVAARQVAQATSVQRKTVEDLVKEFGNEAATLVPNESQDLDIRKFRLQLAACTIVGSFTGPLDTCNLAAKTKFAVSFRNSDRQLGDGRVVKSGTYMLYVGANEDLYTLYVNQAPPESKNHIPVAVAEYGQDQCVIYREKD